MCVFTSLFTYRINKNDNQKPAGKNKDKKNSCNSDMILTIKYFYFLFLLSTIDFHVYAKKYFSISLLVLNKNIKLSIRDSAKYCIYKK